MDAGLLDKLTESLRKVEWRVDFERCKKCIESVEENKKYKELLNEQKFLNKDIEPIKRKDAILIMSYIYAFWFLSFLLMLFLISRGHYKLIQILYGPMDNQPFIWTLLFWIFIGMVILNLFGGFGYMFWSIPAQIYNVIVKKYNISKTTNKKRYYALLVFLIFSSTFVLSPWVLHYVFGVWEYDPGFPYPGDSHAQWILKDWGVLDYWYYYQINLKEGDEFFAKENLEDLHKLIDKYNLNSFSGVLDLYGPWKYVYIFYALLGIIAVVLTEYAIWEQKKQQKEIQIKKEKLQQNLSQTPRYIVNNQSLSSHNLTPEQCKSELEHLIKFPEKALFTLIKPYLSNALTAFEAGRYGDARDNFRKALEKLSSAELPLKQRST